jgi:hypothetical protein
MTETRMITELEKRLLERLKRAKEQYEQLIPEAA